LFLITTIILVGFLAYQLVVKTAEVATLTAVAFDMACILGIVLMMVTKGVSINRQALEHRSLLLKKTASIEATIAIARARKPTGEDYQQTHLERLNPEWFIPLKSVVKISQAMIQIMEIDHLENPLTILGFSANSNFRQGIISYYALSYIVLISS
jgi:hypothetical protein